MKKRRWFKPKPQSPPPPTPEEIAQFEALGARMRAAALQQRESEQ
jgi:hypothetical protein